jgi:YbbR domain-containing protein
VAVLRFLFRNWPLKLAAVLLATLLYAGVIVSATTETFPGKVPIQIRNAPSGAIVLGGIEDVTSIRYLILGTGNRTMTTGSFAAWVDLSGVRVEPGMPPISVPVSVQATESGTVQILDYNPQRIQVTLDPISAKPVPVRVDQGTVPAGVDPRPPIVDPPTVVVSGPDSRVRTVTAALARVHVDPSALDVNELVTLVPIDALGNSVDSVELTPQVARIKIQVDPKSTTRTLPVNPIVAGTPALHVSVTNVTADPLVVTVEGSPQTLAALEKIDTLPVSVEGATGDVTSSVGLALPDGVTAIGVTTVRVTVTLERDVGSRSYPIGVRLAHANPTTTYDVAVDQVVATVGGPLSALDALDPTHLAAMLDVAGYGPGTHRIPVVIDVPSTLTLISVAPQEVSVTITPAPTPTPEPSASGSPSPAPSGSAGPTPIPAP